MKSNGERGHPVTRSRRFGANSRARNRSAARASGFAQTRPSRMHTTLTAEIHSTSTGFGDRLSTPAHGLEWNARSRVRLECATLEAVSKIGNGHAARSAADAHH
ncbi:MULTISPECIES: hypothetical protein [unclassified Burkholderia]|uniref:hypothetical protein n=1 Tax=unclassified Burkholderia TaxID=2613784 RepID=UPI001E475F51|nr:MULTISPECIES: hypothetical protein [unclassified Burkholderia]UEP27629.1 hypothetical protein LMA01_15200 [Burkholderia sp. B21-007]UEP41167.1 hypothetical protein LMA02_15230 [Burkholderia sp. B21-005]